MNLGAKNNFEKSAAAFASLEALKRLGVIEAINSLDVRSPLGEAIRRSIKPFMRGEEREFNSRFSSISAIAQWVKANKETLPRVLAALSGVEDIRPILKAENFNQTSIFALKKTISSLLTARRILLQHDSSISALVPEAPFEEFETLGGSRHSESGFSLPDGFSPELKRLRGEVKELRKKLEAAKKALRERLALKLNMQNLSTNEFVIDRSDTILLNMAQNDPDFVVLREYDACVHFKAADSPEIQSLAAALASALEKQRAEERVIYNMLGAKVAELTAELIVALEEFGKFDYTLAVARFAVENECCIPSVSQMGIKLCAARYLPLQKSHGKRGEDYTPLDVEIPDSGAVITGSNMGGKTVALFTIGYMQALAQYGLPVPAKNFETKLFNALFFMTADEDNPDAGLSAFGREVAFFKESLSYDRSPALFVMDEPARTTNIIEGRALFLAALEKILQGGSCAVVTTHDERLAARSGLLRLKMAGLKPEAGAKALNRGVEAVRKLMDYRLVSYGEGAAKTDAIRVAELMGMDSAIIARALDLHKEEIQDN